MFMNINNAVSQKSQIISLATDANVKLHNFSSGVDIKTTIPSVVSLICPVDWWLLDRVKTARYDELS